MQNEKNQKLSVPEGSVCIACGGALTGLSVFHNMPASAQDIPAREELDTERAVDLTLCQCRDCGLVQFAVEPVHYYRDVIRAGGGSSTMRQLRHAEYTRLLAQLLARGVRKPKIIEVGCGRGEFLGMWDLAAAELLPAAAGDPSAAAEKTEAAGAGTDISAGAQNPAAGSLLPWLDTWYSPAEAEAIEKLCRETELVGLEHQPQLVNTAKESGLNVYEGFAEGHCDFPEAPFDAFVQFNFLEHQPHPKDMLETIWRNLKPGGLGLLTVPSFEYILEHDGYYELLRDHIANYTEETLTRLLLSCGFAVLSLRRVNRDTIEALVEKSETEKLAVLPASASLQDVSALTENYEVMKRDINAYLETLSAGGRSLAIWGASHQGFTLAATTELSGKVRYIIDSAPFKQGRFAPASHIPIVPPAHFHEEPVDELLIVAPGYTDEIAGIIRRDFGEKVRILVLKSKRVTEYRKD